MRNFLPVKMWLIFDLKGATANRRALTKKILHHRSESARSATDYGTLRDWEWMDAAMCVDDGPADKAVLADMLVADSKFLAEQGSLDYSLLVGIHRLSRELGPAERDAEIAQLRAAGGFPSIDRQKVYFFGIIDVLERYTWGWWAQHWLLTCYYYMSFQHHKADGISALSPGEYADRFSTFMQREVLQVSDEPSQEDLTSAVGGLQGRPPVSNLLGDQRWGHLLMRRRRGLLTERIQAERADYIRRIEELQSQLAGTPRAR